MKCVICLFSVAWISYGATADAQLEIVEPASNAVVSLLTPAQELFLRLPPSARRTLIADRKQGRPYLNRVKWWPEPVHVKWTDAGTGPYSLKILRDGEEVFATNGLEQCHFDVWNLEVAREYRIRVSGGATAVESTFRTSDHAPRLLRIDSIPNVRDLGGRIGLDGRRVRQGLIYRSAGLNENANDYCTGPETYELWKTGRLADSEEGREYLVWINEHKTLRPEDFKEMKKTMVVKNWRPGFDRLTSVDRDYMARKLGIRTDIDLRSKRECYGMKGSPLGESVRWIHAPYSAYGGITNEMGRTAFSKAFSALLDERNYPVDFHCIAGADRTGSLAYLLNALLGVREDELTKDWEVTVWWSPTMHGHAVCLDQLSAALSSFPGETVCERAENYAIQAGFSRADIEKFRKIMLEDVRLAAVHESGDRVDLSGVPFKMPAIELPHFPAREFSIVDFGARSNGEKCTEAIARAIGACADAGGGRVIVPDGVFHTGAIRLKSNVELCLSSGAVLDFSDDPEDYMPAVASSFEGIECMNRSSLVYAYGCTNVAITGSGLLRPRIGFWLRWSGSRSANSLSRKASDQLTLWGDLGTPVSERNFVGLTESRARPQTLLFNRCRNVRLKDFRIRGTPFWTIHLYRCENAVAKGLDVCCHVGDVHTPDYFQGLHLNNSDGMDIEMSRNVLVEDCSFCQGDDAVVIKSGRGPDGYVRGVPSANIVIRRCEVRFGHGLLAIGSELSAGVRNVYCSDCKVGEVGNVFFAKSNKYRRGFVENVWIENIIGKKAETVLRINSHYPASTLSPKTKAVPPTRIRNIQIKNVQLDEARHAVEILGAPDNPAENISVSDVMIGKIVPVPCYGDNNRNTPCTGKGVERGDLVVTVNVKNFEANGIRLRETPHEELAFPQW